MSFGYTFLEILIVVSLLALVSFAVIPNLKKFNEDQDLTSAVDSLRQSLRIAQSSAISGIKCQSSPALTWTVSIDNNSAFSIKALCYDPTGQTSPGSETRLIPTIPASVTIFSDNCSASTSQIRTDVVFSGSGVNFICTQNPAVPPNPANPYTFTFKNSKNGQTKTVTIDNGGRIY